MLKPEQVPDEVWMAARLELVDGPIREDREDRYRHAITAALNAWPGVGRVEGLMDGDDVVAPPAIFLPLPTEASDEA